MKPPLGDTLVICDMDNTLLTAKEGIPACNRAVIRLYTGIHPRGAWKSEAVAAGYLLQWCAAV